MSAEGCCWPFADVLEVDLHVTARTAGFACTTLVAEVDTPVAPLVFANHVPSWQLNFELERQLQALAAARSLEQLAWDGTSCWRETSPPTRIPPARASSAAGSHSTGRLRALRRARRPTLEITGCERVLDEPVNGVWGSDHFGVVADLELPRAR
jgi:hypothetical protein